MKKHSLLILLLIVCWVGNTFAQESSQKITECENYGKNGFVGKTTNLDVKDVKLNDILNKITDQFGCNFVVDKSVNVETITVEVKDVPWNILLDSILRSQDLGIQINGNILRVADVKTLAEKNPKTICIDILGYKSPLYTEFIKLKYVPNEEIGFGKEKLLGLIKRRLSKWGWVEFDEKSNALIITDRQENLVAIKQLIEILDEKVNIKEYLEQKKKQEDALKNRPSNK